jgi:hypothetical protein
MIPVEHSRRASPVVVLDEILRERIPEADTLSGIRRIIDGHTVTLLLEDSDEAVWKASMLGSVAFLVDDIHNADLASADDDVVLDSFAGALEGIRYILGPQVGGIPTRLIQHASRIEEAEAAYDIQPIPMIVNASSPVTAAARFQEGITRGQRNRANEEEDARIAFEKNIQLDFLLRLMRKYPELPSFAVIQEERDKYLLNLRRRGIEAEGLV